MDWISTVAGEDAADFLAGSEYLGKPTAFIDPSTNKEVTFQSNPDRFKELNTLNTSQNVDIKTVYSDTGVETW